MLLVAKNSSQRRKAIIKQQELKTNTEQQTNNAGEVGHQINSKTN
jgi:hypothetical protein